MADNERTPGRQPVQIVEFKQPLCGNVYGKGVCRASPVAETLIFEFKNDNSTFVGNNGFVEFGGSGSMRCNSTATAPSFSPGGASLIFNGDDARYIIVRGRIVTGQNNEWSLFWGSDYPVGIVGTTLIIAENRDALRLLSDGDEFMAVFDASTSTDYAVKWVGSNIDNFRLDFEQTIFPTAVDVHSITVSASNPLDKIGLECYDTRATCQDVDNYRHSPEFLLTPDVIKNVGDEILSTEIVAASNMFAAVDVYIPITPTGVIWEQGGSGVGSYVGFTSGELVWRIGNGSVPLNNLTARLAVDASAFHNKNVTLLLEYNDVEGSASLWIWDEIERVITFMGEAVAVTPPASWAGGDVGGVGFHNVYITSGEDNTDYNGDIHELRIYNNLAAPQMANPFVLPLFYASDFVAEQTIKGADYIVPSLKSVSTVPTKINLSGSNPDAKGLGNRAVMNIKFGDHPGTDQGVDPYLVTRLGDPMRLGSYWSKWMVRNAYRYNMAGLVHEGYLGQSIAEMSTRSYILTGASGPDEPGRVGFQFKDILARLEERKAQAPAASNGVLVSGIDDATLAFSVEGATASEYPATGTVRIGDELITYASWVVNGTNLDFTATARGSDGSQADDHNAEDTVQSCLRFTNQKINAITETLLVDWSGFSRGYIDKNGTFKSETENYLSAYIFSVVISEPTAVSKLLSELQEQAGFNIWWHEKDQLVKMAAVRGVDAEPPLLTDSDHIIAGSFSIKDAPKSRISQVWLSYGVSDPTKSLKENSTFKQTKIQADLASEGVSQYGEASIRKINSRWINTGGQALSTTSKIVARYSKVPRVAGFRVDAKDREHWVGDRVRVSHFLDVMATGARRIATWTIVSARETVPGEIVEYALEDTTLYGKIVAVQATGAADYPGVELAAFGAAYIGDKNGLLSDGTPCARIT